MTNPPAFKFDPKRGFLSNYPPDVIAVINGRPITRADALQAKQEKQRRQLARKRNSRDPVVKPAFIWTFYNPNFPYGGWWLYVRTLKQSWWIKERSDDQKLILKAMSLFPCGLLPMMENYGLWKRAFAEMYHWPTVERPENQGMAICRVEISCNGWLVDIHPLTTPQKPDRIHTMTTQPSHPPK